MQGPVCQLSVPSIKEGWKTMTSHQAEALEHINILQTDGSTLYQDGRAPYFQENFGTRWLSMQAEPQRRLFFVPLNKQSRKYVHFKWEGSLYKFPCLCFGLGPVPRLFTKLIKVLVSFFRILYVRTMVYLEDFVILWKAFEETTLSRDTVIYLLRNLGFVINLKNQFFTQRRQYKFWEW